MREMFLVIWGGDLIAIIGATLAFSFRKMSTGTRVALLLSVQMKTLDSSVLKSTDYRRIHCTAGFQVLLMGLDWK